MCEVRQGRRSGRKRRHAQYRYSEIGQYRNCRNRRAAADATGRGSTWHSGRTRLDAPGPASLDASASLIPFDASTHPARRDAARRRAGRILVARRRSTLQASTARLAPHLDAIGQSTPQRLASARRAPAAQGEGKGTAPGLIQHASARTRHPARSHASAHGRGNRHPRPRTLDRGGVGMKVGRAGGRDRIGSHSRI